MLKPFEENLKEFGGAKRDRTADLLHAMQALSQLSYSPIRVPALSGSGNPSESTASVGVAA